MSDTNGVESSGERAAADEQKEPLASRQRSTSTSTAVGVEVGGSSGPMEEEEMARKTLQDLGFDPDNVTEELAEEESFIFSWDSDDHLGLFSGTPMTYFCYKGDLKMCRYLLARGASTTQAFSDDPSWRPMNAAAISGNVDVCKWLAQNGAQGHNYPGQDPELSPLWSAIHRGEKNRTETTRWLILNGALSSPDDPGTIADKNWRDIFHPYAGPNSRVVRAQLLSWAEEAVQSHDLFVAFLLGTWSPHVLGSEVASSVIHSRSKSPLQHLSGKSGVLELIANFVGFVRGRELRIRRQLAELLPP